MCCLEGGRLGQGDTNSGPLVGYESKTLQDGKQVLPEPEKGSFPEPGFHFTSFSFSELGADGSQTEGTSKIRRTNWKLD